MIEKSFIIGSIVSIIIGIILLFIAYNFFNKNYVQESNKDTVQNQVDKLNIEKMHKFLAKILGIAGLLFIGVPIYIYYIETHPEFLQTNSNNNNNTRTRYSTNTSTQALKLFF